MKNTIFDLDSIAKLMKKLTFYFFVFLILASCNSTKHVAEDKHMPTQNYIYVDSVRNKSSELQKYINRLSDLLYTLARYSESELDYVEFKKQ